MDKSQEDKHAEESKRTKRDESPVRVKRGEYCMDTFNKSLPEIAEDMLSSDKTSPERKDIARRFLASLNDLTSDYEDIEDVPEDEIEKLENEFIKELSATSTQFYIKG